MKGDKEAYDKWMAKALSGEGVLAEYQLDFSMADALGKWLLFGLYPGRFLEAWLSNDLKEAMCLVGRDTSSLRQLFMTCHWRLPGCAWGSKKKFEVWTRYARMAGGAHINDKFSLEYQK